MLRKIMKRQRGFTLIELLIVVAIIGIIAALLIPNFLESLQKAKQKRTMADLRSIGTAEMAWLTDEAGAAAAGFDLTSYTGNTWAVNDVVATILEDGRYIQNVPEVDGWKHPICLALNTGNPLAYNVMANGSRAYCPPGEDCSGACTVAGLTLDGTGGRYDPKRYEVDIIWADGTFAQWPEKLTAAGE